MPDRVCAEAKTANAMPKPSRISCWKQSAPMPIPRKFANVAIPVICPLCLGSREVVILDIKGCVASNPTDRAVITTAATNRGLRGSSKKAAAGSPKEP